MLHVSLCVALNWGSSWPRWFSLNYGETTVWSVTIAPPTVSSTSSRRTGSKLVWSGSLGCSDCHEVWVGRDGGSKTNLVIKITQELWKRRVCGSHKCLDCKKWISVSLRCLYGVASVWFRCLDRKYKLWLWFLSSNLFALNKPSNIVGQDTLIWQFEF